MRTKTLYLLILLMMGTTCFGQDSSASIVNIEERGDSVRFSSHLRPLRQLAGAPACFYTYFWEMGDGRFSFDKEPVYAYRDTGTYHVRLYATNNYDDGKAPPTRPRPVKIRKKPLSRDAWASHFFHGAGNIEMKINRYPRPGENFVTVIGYRNQSAGALSGSIVLFYNERQLGREGFAMADERFYNKENGSSLPELMATLQGVESKDLAGQGNWAGARMQSRERAGWRAAVSADDRGPGAEEWEAGIDPLDEDAVEKGTSTAQSMLRTLDRTYTQHTVVHFPAMQPGEEKFVFLEMNTLPEMLQDTNATVGFSAMLVPDDPAASPELCQMNVQVVSSHDPNRFLFESRRINYRFFRQKKELSYRLQFQNTGNGPTRKVRIGIGLPPQLDPRTFVLKEISPKCPICNPAYPGRSCIDTFSRGDSVYIVFNNIYLPGLQQSGVHDPDSTEGFVAYGIKFRKKPRKIPFHTQATIGFDRQPPVMTNRATARFIKGLSPGFMAGYSILPANGGFSSKGPLQFGYVLAPYSPFRPYFQAEVFVGFLQQDAFTGTVVKDNRDTLIGSLPVVVTGRQTVTTTQRNSFEITPLHYRYNLSKWIGIGVGAMVQVNISEQTTTENRVYFSTLALPLNISTASTYRQQSVQWLGSWNAAPFLDVQVGGVRKGPVLGVRYFHLLEGDVTNRFFLYGGFKL